MIVSGFFSYFCLNYWKLSPGWSTQMKPD
jgi:hypothetical protein